jgi:hypothetical protein
VQVQVQVQIMSDEYKEGIYRYIYIYLKRFAALPTATLQLWRIWRICPGGGSLVGIYFVGRHGLSST